MTHFKCAIHLFILSSRFYSFPEDIKILQYIIDNTKFEAISGNTLWKTMENDQVIFFKARSYGFLVFDIKLSNVYFVIQN